jgi:molybdenum cofactor cytidylyltransferase
MGSDKATLRVAGETFLSACVRKLSAVCNGTVVVTGHNAAHIEAAHSMLNVTWALNPDFERGEFSSLQTGIRRVLSIAYVDAVIVAPVDHPGFCETTLRALVSRFWSGGTLAVVKPEYKGRRGHPVLYSRDFCQAVVVASANQTARDIQARFPNQAIVAIDDPGIGLNVDTPGDYDQLTLGQK